MRNKDNEIFISREKKVSLSPGENKVNFNIGKVPAGKYFADLFLKEGKKAVNFGSSFLEITSDTFIQEVKSIKKSYRKDEEIKGEITIFTKTGEENLKIKITQQDNFGRITNKKIIPLGKKKCLFLSEPDYSFIYHSIFRNRTFKRRRGFR